ncbi:Enoyl-CoA hydratase [Entomortierella beljakovae]|nr:Enoyl-CoA hydratase [Entomortierella beljakovae]
MSLIVETATLLYNIQAIVDSEYALLNASMTKEDILSIGQFLSDTNARLTRLCLDQTFKDLQEAIVEFLLLPCCSELQSLEYLACGSSFGQILLSPSTEPAAAAVPLDKLQYEGFIQQQLPFVKTLKSLRLGYNSEAPPRTTDFAILQAILNQMTLLEELSLLNSLDNLGLVEGLKPSTGFRKLSLTVYDEVGMTEEEAIQKIREELKKTVGEEAEQRIEVQVEIDDRGSDLAGILNQDDANPMSAEWPENELPGPIGPMGPSRMVLSKPVIAAITGFAVAGGLELALWCDIRIVDHTATMGVFCRLRGVPLIDGGTVRLPQVVGRGVANDLMFTGRAVKAQEALKIHLATCFPASYETVNETPALEQALALAESLAKHPQVCMRNDRLSTHFANPIREAMLKEYELGLETLSSGEFMAAITSFFEGNKKKNKETKL